MRFSELLDAYAEFWDRLNRPLTGHDISMAVDWSAFGEPDARFKRRMEHHRTHDPDCELCTESCTEPDNTQVSEPCPDDCRPDICPWRTPPQPITSPSGAVAWRERMHAAARIQDDMLAPLIKEITMTDHLADGQPAPGSAWRHPNGATLLYAPIGNDDTDPWFSTEPDGSYGGWLSRDEVDTATLTPLVAADPTVAGTDAALAGLVRDVRDTKAPGYTVQIDGVKIARCDTRGLTNEERASYERGLREGRLDNTVVDAVVIGSAAWLRDLADRVRTSTDYTDATGSTEDAMVAALRHAADKAEHDEEKRARDTRDQERVEKLILGQLADAGEHAIERMRDMCAQMGAPIADAEIPPLDVEGAWRSLPDDAREQSLAYGLQLYRAGRDDQKDDDRG